MNHPFSLRKTMYIRAELNLSQTKQREIPNFGILRISDAIYTYSTELLKNQCEKSGCLKVCL